MPYLITPRTEDEARHGLATLLTPGHIECLINALKESRTWGDAELVIKLAELRA